MIFYSGNGYLIHDNNFTYTKMTATSGMIERYSTSGIGNNVSIYNNKFDNTGGNYGQKFGVSGTPAFFINGKFVSGAQPFSVFKTVIDGELS